MTCEPIEVPGGRGFICGTKQRLKLCGCGLPASLECDWKMPSGRTCDACLCFRCTSSPAPEKDLCPRHARMWESHPANPKNPKQGQLALDGGPP